LDATDGEVKNIIDATARADLIDEATTLLSRGKVEFVWKPELHQEEEVWTDTPRISVQIRLHLKRILMR
jgi:hypothetical protein